MIAALHEIGRVIHHFLPGGMIDDGVAICNREAQRGRAGVSSRALADGTVERIRGHFSASFGFGGLTLPDGGRPIPCRLLIGEMVRLASSFSFLRRSFWADVGRENLRQGVDAIRKAICSAGRRKASEVDGDRAELARAIGEWDGARVEGL